MQLDIQQYQFLSKKIHTLSHACTPSSPFIFQVILLHNDSQQTGTSDRFDKNELKMAALGKKKNALSASEVDSYVKALSYQPPWDGVYPV